MLRRREVETVKIVMKFGGSLVASKGGMRRMADIVARHSRGNSLVVVVSALGGVTDILLDCAANSTRWKGVDISRAVARLQRIHRAAVRGTSLGVPEKERLLLKLGGTLEELRTILLGVSVLRELSPRSRDMIISFGERMAAPILAAELGHRGVESTSLTGGEAGIVTDGSFGEAVPDAKATRRAVRRALLKRLFKGEVPVVTGFVARTRRGDITTLGRGGSDYTATIVADALDADEVWIWTDVDGIMTGDPKVVGSPKRMGRLSYAEAEELAFFGAKNMHPLALGPARLRGIPVRIRNGYKPNLPGTLITAGERRSEGVMKCVAVVKNVGLLSVSGETLQGRPGIAAAVFAALAASRVNVQMISQSVSEANISMVVKRQSLRAAKEAVRDVLRRDGVAAAVEADAGVAVIAAVGAGMRGTRGVAAKIFGAVASEGVNVRMIAQGSSELSISFVVDEKRANAAVRAVHALAVAGSRGR